MEFKSELASLSMGSTNFGLFTILERFDDFRFKWEREDWRRAGTSSSGTPSRTSKPSWTWAANGTRFEYECHDIGHLAHFRRRGLVEGPVFVQSVFGISAASLPTQKT
ncbi:3-keto-5-aminohexanoate cleavage protein [Pseudonocardia lutea]|uniref:3-keto-5-aminohexanoate cleavage protein n=1 Tax=Pseudonocardia lutea TaxID=2172015 RepID=A0ABW1I1J7_9PSEU